MAENDAIVNEGESNSLSRKKWEAPRIEDASIEAVTEKLGGSPSENGFSKTGS